MEASVDTYQDLRWRAKCALDDGRLRDARALFEQGLAWAEKSGDGLLVDRAFCNLSLARIKLGEGDFCRRRLREILARSGDPENHYLAAYHLAYAYELAKRTDKGHFYARIALKRAEDLERSDWLAAAYNRVGNLHLVDSQTEAAVTAYQKARDLAASNPDAFLGTILGNLGYCHLLQGHLKDSFELLYRSWRMLRGGRGGRAALLSFRLDLAFAHLEADRPRSAARHARAALETARDLEDPKSVKNALFILGESASISGDRNRAWEYFTELQEFYPDLPVVTDFLLSLDVRKLVNLRA